MTEVIVTFSGAVNATEADNPAIYRLTLPGKKGSYTARNAKTIKLKSASYNSAQDTVTLIPGKRFALTKPVELVVIGQAPSGLQDSLGRFINGGQSAIAQLSRHGATITDARREIAEVRTHRPRAFSLAPAAVDKLLEREAAVMTTVKHASRVQVGAFGHIAAVTKKRDARRDEPGPQIAPVRVDYRPPLQPWTD